MKKAILSFVSRHILLHCVKKKKKKQNTQKSNGVMAILEKLLKLFKMLNYTKLHVLIKMILTASTIY